MSTDLDEARARFSVMLKMNCNKNKPVVTGNALAASRMRKRIAYEALAKKHHISSDRILTFNVRQKTFELPERTLSQPATLFSLTRAWISPKFQEDAMVDSAQAVDGLVLDWQNPEDFVKSDIYSLPAPKPTKKRNAVIPPVPVRVKPEEVDLNDRNAILNSYLPSWKATRIQWQAYAAKRDQRFNKSLHVLQAIYNATQSQNNEFDIKPETKSL